MSTERNNVSRFQSEAAKRPVAAVNAADSEDTIDLLELAGIVLSKLWIIVLCAVIGASAAGIYTSAFITPTYSASSMIYIYSRNTGLSSIMSELNLGSQLAVDFQIVATTREVMENVIDDVGVNMTYAQLKQATTITNPTDSHILKITVVDTDPEMAATLSNTLADELRSRIADVMNTDEPSMVERAYVPRKAIGPNLMKNVALGGIGGIAAAVAVIVLLYMMDDTIKTEDDVQKYLGLNVLAAIPAERPQKSHSKKKPAKASSRSKRAG